MYAYSHDPETGGLLLTDLLTSNSREPRPVYAPELDLLGFQEFWKYDRQDDLPYLWAEANFYWYRGQRVAHTSGGTLYEKPDIVLETNEAGTYFLPPGSALLPVDLPAMVAKNHAILAALERETIRRIYDAYQRHKDRLDCFHVAFSGGKDSIVLLELVKRALPKSAFIVLFGDTGMEFPDTYDTVKTVEQQCQAEGIAFFRAKSHFQPEDSWKLFGPPSRVLRWCCTVHKAVPQTLKIREIIGKKDFVGMDFVGVRAAESTTRSEYEYENFGKKQKGQYSFNPILEWNSAEIWLFIYGNLLPINAAYKKGNSRAGCLFCPHSGGKSDFFRHAVYPAQVDGFIDLIRTSVTDPQPQSYILNGGWIERKNGRDIASNPMRYFEEVNGDMLTFTVVSPTTDWREWSKTIKDFPRPQNCSQAGENLNVTFQLQPTDPKIKLLKQIFHKAAYCLSCRACEVNCRHGAIHFDHGRLAIENCRQCGQCHQIDDGCLAFHSLQQPRNGGHVMKSLNTFADHAPKPEWLRAFFANGNTFLEGNTLGPMMISMFRRFLADAGLIQKKSVTPLFNRLKQLGENTESVWGILLTNLVHQNPQMAWYIKNLPIDTPVPYIAAIQQLCALAISEKDARSICKAFKRLCETPLGTRLHFGVTTEAGRALATLTRTKCTLSDPRVVLYALFKFAEACDRYYEFTLSRLMDFGIEAAGISPAEIFGFSREEMEQLLHGLARSYPDFITFATTHDLEVVRLSDDKSSADVLQLF